MRKRKILWLIKGLGLGGAEMLLARSAKYIDRETYDYEVAYLLPSKDALVPDFHRQDIPVHSVKMAGFKDVAGLKRLVRLLKEREIDIVHTHLPYAGIVGRIAAKMAGVRHSVYTEHNVPDMYHPLTARLNRMTYGLDKATVAVSDRVAASIPKNGPFSPKSLSVIRGGVDLDFIASDNSSILDLKGSLGITNGTRIVGNVANIRWEKGHDYLLQTAKLVSNEINDVKFVIVGGEKNPGDIANLKSRAAELGVSDHVIMTGSRPDASSLMKTFDIFTLSSLYEGLPIALLEAMAIGVPPVVTSVGGIPEVVEDGVNGYLVEPMAPQHMADRIVSLLSQESLRADMSKHAMETVKAKFSIAGMVQDLESVYDSLLGSERPRAAKVMS